MKNSIKYILQNVLGFERYLFLFSKFKIRTLRKDKNERDFFHFLNLIQPGKGDVLDIGANIGIMTYHLSKKQVNGKVHSIEPVPANFAVLNKIVQNYHLENVHLIPVALGQKPGTLTMILPYNGKTKMQGLSHVKHESIVEWNEGEEFEVAVKTLDELFLDTPIQAMKIDIENFEYFAFLGGRELLLKYHPVIYAELWDNDNRKNTFAFLGSLGYSIFVIENDQMVEFNSNTHVTQNFIFKVS